MKYSFLRYFWAKSSQIWHKNEFKFFKFLGTNLGWGGVTSLGPKVDTSVGWGIDKIFAGWGTPKSPQEKTLIVHMVDILHTKIYNTFVSVVGYSEHLTYKKKFTTQNDFRISLIFY